MSTEIVTYSGTEKALTQGIEAGIIEICTRIVTEAKSLQQPDTGQLRNSIMWKTDKSDGGFNDSSGEKATDKIKVNPKQLQGYVGSNLNYATYQEFGTRYMKPQPYLRPAIALVQGQDEGEILKKIKEETARGPLYEGRKVESFR